MLRQPSGHALCSCEAIGRCDERLYSPESITKCCILALQLCMPAGHGSASDMAIPTGGFLGSVAICTRLAADWQASKRKQIRQHAQRGSLPVETAEVVPCQVA